MHIQLNRPFEFPNMRAAPPSEKANILGIGMSASGYSSACTVPIP
jgi:hypothetical protein